MSDELTSSSALALAPAPADQSLARVAEPALIPAVEPGHGDPSRAFQPNRTIAPQGLGLSPAKISEIAANLAMVKAGQAPGSEAGAAPAARFDPVAYLEKNPDANDGFIHELRREVVAHAGEERAVELLFAFADAYRDEFLEYFGDQWLATIAPHVDPADLASLPKDLADFVPRLRDETWKELSWMSPTERLRELRQLKNEVEAAEAQYQDERRQRDVALNNYLREQLQGLQQLASKHEAAKMQDISDWRPFNDNEPANARAQARIVNLAMGWMANSSRMRALQEDAYEDLQLAGIHQMDGRAGLANAHASSALQKVDSWNAFFDTVLSAELMDYHAMAFKATAWDKLEAERKRMEEAEQKLNEPITAETVTPDKQPGQPGRFKIPAERLRQIVDYVKAVNDGR